MRNNRKPIEEEEEEEEKTEKTEKELEIESHTLKPFPSFIQNEKEEEKEVEVDIMDGIVRTN